MRGDVGGWQGGGRRRNRRVLAQMRFKARLGSAGRRSCVCTTAMDGWAEPALQLQGKI